MVVVMTASLSSELARAEQRYRHFRTFKDKLFRFVMTAGGLTVIGALLTIFVFLVYVVLPLFQSAGMTQLGVIPLAGPAPVRLDLAEHGDTAFALGGDASYRFFEISTGKSLLEGRLTPPETILTALNDSTRSARTIAASFGHGKVLLASPQYRETFVGAQRTMTPALAYPLGPDPVQAVPKGKTIVAIAAEANDDGATIAALANDRMLYLTNYVKVASLLDGEQHVESTQVALKVMSDDVSFMTLNESQQALYVISKKGLVSFFDIHDKNLPRLTEVQVLAPDAQVTAVEFLSGGTSLLIGDSLGKITQWFPIRDQNNRHQLTQIRTFAISNQPVALIVPEFFRKGFAAIDSAGALGLFHTTAERTVYLQKGFLATAPSAAALSPRGDALILLNAHQTLARYDVQNRYPEVSWHSLWGRVWYEGRRAPEFIWQSSSSSNDFEPKFSLTPLAFGTLKATVYAMFFAIPVAVLGAIYTAYFMNAGLRRYVKPSIEIMAALPTVILGFLAGLWLAPLIELRLLGFLGATFLMPLAIFGVAWVWSRLPAWARQRLPQGTEVILLVPLVCGVLWVAMNVSHPLEQLWFGGNLPRWLGQTLGITFDQRNSLVVGIAMGFAVIPNIYSISEDAIFGVPHHLSVGSLALGATSWQTLTRVVLLTASPGIFSGIVIGLGRAVGETMIVLMATGNTPIMDLNIFQGFRALSANIAVEMPESALNSSHYRILFLAALVLFGVTFLFNTVAEIVRQRLRSRYGNL